MTEQNKNLKENNSATQTPKGYGFSFLLQEILKIVSLPEDLIRCVFAVALSIRLDLSPPLWLMLVGVPSSAKTDIISFLRKLDFVYFLDSMTLNPFASGYKPSSKGKVYDLLPELDGKCFVCKDYTTIFSLNEETTKKLLGELVSIYDGEFSKFSPTRGSITYKSSFSHIGAITPAALNRHQRYLNIIGARFIFYRIPRLDEDRKIKGFSIAWNKIDRKQLIEDISEKVVTFFQQLLDKNPTQFEIPDPSVRDTLEKLSLLMARSRGIVILQKDHFVNEEGKQISYFDILDIQIEEPWRAFQQLRGLGTSLALLDNRRSISDSDLAILKHIVLSSMPADRAEALEHFLSNPGVTARELSDTTGKSIRTSQRLLKELEGLEIIVSTATGQGIAKNYTLKEECSIIKPNQENPVSPSESLSRLIPQKPVSQYSNDELQGVLRFIEDYIRENSPTDTIRAQYLALAAEIEQEGKRRNIFDVNQLPLSEQLWIDESLKESRVRL